MVNHILPISELRYGTFIGAGSLGSVHRGTYRGADVAIKKLHSGSGCKTSAQLDAFSSELHILKTLQHHSLTKIIGAACDSQCICIVTELAKGGSLHAFLHEQRKQIPAEHGLSIAADVVGAIQFLHGQAPSIVHGNLKSMNVMLDSFLSAQVCDSALIQIIERV